jgi:hypothetical protein
MPRKSFNIPFKEQDDFGTLCICSLRYCMGRQTYMPSLVRDIIRPLLPKLSDKDLAVMLQDCDFQRKYEMYGDPMIDKPGWETWEQELLVEKEKMGMT